MRSRGGWLPLLVLLVLIIGIPTIDVWLIFQVGHQIGALPTLAVLVVEAVIGGLLMRHEGRRAWSALNDAFNSGRMPTGELADAALVLVGGVLLMLPGFATDLIGFLFLLPITRPYARRVLAFFVARRISRLGWDPRVSAGSLLRPGTSTVDDRRGAGPASGVVIEGDVIDPPPTPEASRPPTTNAGEIADTGGKN
jgi:UPF0716 protein FxsA